MKTLTIVVTFLIVAVQGFNQKISQVPQLRADRSSLDVAMDPGFPGKQVNHLVNAGDIGNPPDVNWIKQFGGDGNDVGQKTITDAGGNVYSAGYFSGPFTIGGTNLTSVGYVDAYLAKFNNGGTLLWVKQLSCQTYEMVRIYGMTIDHPGNIYITGYFNGQFLNVGNNTLFKTGNEDLFIAKYNSDGQVLVATHHGTYGMDLQGRSIAADASGNIFVINGGHNILGSGCTTLTRFNANGQLQWNYENGAFFTDLQVKDDMVLLTGFLTGEVMFGTTILSATSIRSAPFIAMCNTDGVFSWAVQGVTTGTSSAYNRALSLSLDGSGNIYICGRFRRTLTFGSQVITNPGIDYAPFIVRCTTDGSFVWAKSAQLEYSSSAGNYTRIADIAADDPGNVYLTCELAEDTLNFNGFTVGGDGSCLVRFDPDGNVQWVVSEKATLFDVYATSGNKLIYTGCLDGNVLITQTGTNAVVDWTVISAGNSGLARVLSLETDNEGALYTYGLTDVQTSLFGSTTGSFLAKMKPDGAVLWSLPFAGGHIETGYGDYLSIDPDGNIGAMGYFYDTLRIGGKTLINTGQQEVVFIAKISPAGNVFWVKQIGIGQNCTGYSLTADKSGNFITSGVFYNQMNIGNHTLISSGYEDFFLAMFDGNGNVVWAQRAGGEETEYESFVSTDSLNNIYLAGEFLSRNITFDNDPLTLTENDGDVIVAKYNPNGAFQWATQMGGELVPGSYERYNCWPTAIKTTGGGDSYLYGWTGPANIYGPFTLESPYNYNFFVTKLNNQGIVQWARIIREKKYGWHSMQIDLDTKGNLYLGGNFYDTLYFNDQMIAPQGERDLFFGRFDGGGNLDWVKFFNSNPLVHKAQYNPTNNLNGIAVYDSASVFIGGSSTYDLKCGTGILHSSNQNGYIGLLGQDIPYGIGPAPEVRARLVVYPNPAKDKILVDVTGLDSGRGLLQILDVDGRSVRQFEVEPGQQTISVSLAGLSPGIYLMKLDGAKRTLASKFVVQ